MASLTLQRCLQHPEREAVARCPECARFFCRECITEYEDRMICAACLTKMAKKEIQRHSFWRFPLRAMAVLVGLLVLISIYHSLGYLLLKVPSSFHEGTVWKKSWVEPNPENSGKETAP